MSRWVNTFENHQFHSSWNTAKEELNNIDKTKITDDNQLIEMARLEKVVEYIDGYLKLIDPDINILNMTNNLNNMDSYTTNVKNELVNFNSSKNLTYIQNANSHIDNLLGQLRALTIYIPKTTGQSIVGMLKKYNNIIDTALQEIDLASVIDDSNQIKKYKNELLEDDEHESILTQVNQAFTDIKEKHEALQEYYNITLNDNAYDNTLKELIQNAKDEVVEADKTVKEKLTELTTKIDKFDKYYIQIFGELNEDEERVGGLKKEIELQQAKLNDFEKQQQEKHKNILQEKVDALDKYLKETQEHHKNLHAQIESLLPGATSAGLAEAYHIERGKFEKPIKTWNRLFISAIMIMFFATFISFISINVSETGWDFSLIQVKGYEDTLNNLLHKFPLYGPLIWLAIYASKRRSENQRLEQEYAHKEALARSYSSYKQQIEGLNQKDEALLKMLLESSIKTVAKNASDSLDKKHGDGTPSKEFLEQVGAIYKKVTGQS